MAFCFQAPDAWGNKPLSHHLFIGEISWLSRFTFSLNGLLIDSAANVPYRSSSGGLLRPFFLFCRASTRSRQQSRSRAQPTQVVVQGFNLVNVLKPPFQAPRACHRPRDSLPTWPLLNPSGIARSNSVRSAMCQPAGGSARQ